LLKWNEIAKKKTELGKKINYVHNSITQRKIGEDTSQESFEKLFKPVTSKLDNVIDNNLYLRFPQIKKRQPKKVEEGIDYAPEVDPYEDMDVEGLINYGDYVPPQQEKQIEPKPPTYEESLQDFIDVNKEIYIDPQYIPLNPQELPPVYEKTDEVNYALSDKDMAEYILNDIGMPNYDIVKLFLERP